jgi:hypothetical protein
MQKRMTKKINQSNARIVKRVSTEASAKLNVNQSAAKMKEIQTAAVPIRSTTIKDLINRGRA